MKNLKTKIILLLILIIASFLRFYQLGLNPPSLTWDEVAWGYNAYSLGIDGRDEFGRFLPYDYLESFGDFKPPAYAYLTILPVKLFGLNEFATRFPSAFFGVLSVLMTFFLVRRIFSDSKQRDKIAIFSMLFIAISPWHIMLSRAAFEANVATFFIITGVWTFLAGIQGKKWYLLASAASFILSIYTFNTARIVSPLLVLLLAISFRKELIASKKQTILAFILGLLLILPVVGFLFSPQASLRFKEVNIFTNGKIIEVANQEIANDNNALWSKIIHNRRLAFSVEYLKHYFDNFNPRFLFVRGDGNPKFSTQSVGEMYLWDIPFFIAGVFLLIRRKEGYWWLVPLWLIIGIIPAGVARETPHALRIETTLPTFQILIAYGFVELINMIKKRKKLIISILLALLFINVTYFTYDYFNHYAKDYSGEWQYGYKESIDYVSKNKQNYEKIKITSELGRPYIYYLFYMKTSPEVFRKEVKITRDPFGFVNVEKLGNLEFGKYSAQMKKGTGGDILYINDKYNIPSDANILKKFYLLNGQEVLTAYTL